MAVAPTRPEGPPVDPEPCPVILDSIPALVWVAGPAGAIEYLNRPCLDYVGLPMGDLVGWDWQKVIHPDDLPKTLSAWAASLRTGAAFEARYRIRRHDGAYRWFIARAIPQPGPDGRPARWFGTCTDVDDWRRADAARRATEGLFRAVVERSHEGFVLAGADGLVRYTSPAVTRILGLPPEEVVGQNLLDLAHPDSRDGLGAWLRFLTARPDERVEVTYRFRHRDGTYRRVEVRASNLLGDPDVAAVVVQLWDVGGAPARTSGE
jgi:PAS domain S-box-containing protein